MRANRKIDKLTDKKEVFTKIKNNWNNVIKFLSGKKSEGEEKTN